ncbi:MAG: phage portal protein [Oscillospiraceae bacterium]|nr:phage portal protein [Oscillospiraceae bacterium]
MIGTFGAFGALPEGYGEHIGRIEEWREIYAGRPPWGHIKKSGLYGKGDRRIAQLGCAKVLCESLSGLTFGTQADIRCADERQREFILDVLQYNGFWENMPAFFSRAYALGGGVIRAYESGGEIVLDYMGADQFIPLSASHGRVDGGIFVGTVYRDGKRYELAERHIGDVIERALFHNGKRCDVKEVTGLDEVSTRDSAGFAYFRPAIADPDGQSLFGMSAFAGCTDTLRAIDTVFDSFTREFILGRKRIIVPSSCIRTVVDPDTGRVCRYFDTDDEVYQALKCDEDRDLKITDNTAELRVDEHIDALNALLDILCFQTGLSAGTLSFNASGLKTAAEIRSMETRTEITMQQERALAAELIESVAVIICRIGEHMGLIRPTERVHAVFSDRQTADSSELIDRNIKLVEAGLRSPVRAVMEIDDCTEEEAVSRIGSEVMKEGS